MLHAPIPADGDPMLTFRVTLSGRFEAIAPEGLKMHSSNATHTQRFTLALVTFPFGAWTQKKRTSSQALAGPMACASKIW